MKKREPLKEVSHCNGPSRRPLSFRRSHAKGLSQRADLFLTVPRGSRHTALDRLFDIKVRDSDEVLAPWFLRLGLWIFHKFTSRSSSLKRIPALGQCRYEFYLAGRRLISP